MAKAVSAKWRQAVCEAVTRPGMQFVAIKSCEITKWLDVARKISGNRLDTLSARPLLVDTSNVQS